MRKLAALILLGFITACVPPKPTATGNVVQQGRSTTALSGTWELVSTKITRNDTTLLEGGPPEVTSIRIMNGTHYSVLTHRNGMFVRAGAGRYTIRGPEYVEYVDDASGQFTAGERFIYTARLDGNELRIEGRSRSLHIREVWRRRGVEP